MSSLAVSRQREHLASSNRGRLSVGRRLLDVEEPEPDNLSLAVILIFGVDIGFGSECPSVSGRVKGLDECRCR